MARVIQVAMETMINIDMAALPQEARCCKATVRDQVSFLGRINVITDAISSNIQRGGGKNGIIRLLTVRIPRTDEIIADYFEAESSTSPQEFPGLSARIHSEHAQTSLPLVTTAFVTSIVIPCPNFLTQRLISDFHRYCTGELN